MRKTYSLYIRFCVILSTLISACKTVNDEACDIPFQYRGKTYHTCTYDYSSGKPWCQANITYKNGESEESWGVCDKNCPHDHYSGIYK